MLPNCRQLSRGLVNSVDTLFLDPGSNRPESCLAGGLTFVSQIPIIEF